MGGWWQQLADFLETLWSRDPDALAVRRRLRDLALEVNEAIPGLWNPRTATLGPVFGSIWAPVSQTLGPFRDLFDRTVASADPAQREASYQFLVEALLGGDLALRRRALGLAALKERLLASADPARELAQVTAEFNSLLMDLRRQDSEGLQTDFEGLQRLAALASHAWTPLLTPFGYDAAAPTQVWTSASGAEALPRLLDLYFVIEGLHLGPGVERLVGHLWERVGPAGGDQRRRAGAAIDRLREALRTSAAAGIVLRLIRLASGDPDFEPRVARFPDRVVQTYAGTLADRFARDREQALRDQSASTVDAEIRALFPGATLLPLPHYGPETHRRLLDAGLPGLTAVLPLQVLRSFGYAVLRTGYLDAVRRVSLEAHPLDPDWNQGFDRAIETVEGLLERLTAFDEGWAQDQRTGLGALTKYLTGKLPPGPATRTLVDRANRSAQNLLEGEARALSTLARFVGEVLGDFRAPRPQRVANIRTLGGTGQKGLVETLISGYNRTAQLVRILRNFVVIAGEEAAKPTRR